MQVVVEGNTWDRSACDVCIAGLGWVGLGLKGEAELRVWRYPHVAVTTREALLPVLAKRFESPGWSTNTKALGSRKTAADKARAQARRDATRSAREGAQTKRGASTSYTPAHREAGAELELLSAERAAEAEAAAGPQPEYQPVGSVRASKRALRKKVKQRAEGVAAGAASAGAHAQTPTARPASRPAAQRAQWPAVSS